jgi:quinol monooxygenase YgiN
MIVQCTLMLVLTDPTPQGKSSAITSRFALKNRPLADTTVLEIDLSRRLPMPITVIAKLKVKPESEAAFESAAKEMIATVRSSEPGTLTYILHKNTKEPGEFMYYEVYQDQAAFDSHGKTDHMKAFGGKIGSLLAGRPEISVLNEVAKK